MMMYVGLRIVEKLYLFRYEIELCAVKKSRRYLDPVCFRLSCTPHSSRTQEVAPTISNDC